MLSLNFYALCILRRGLRYLHPVIGEVNHWPREQQHRMDSTLGVQGSRGEHDRSKALRVFQRKP